MKELSPYHPFPLVESSLKLFDRCFLAPTQPSGERLRYVSKLPPEMMMMMIPRSVQKLLIKHLPCKGAGCKGWAKWTGAKAKGNSFAKKRKKTAKGQHIFGISLWLNPYHIVLINKFIFPQAFTIYCTLRGLVAVFNVSVHLIFPSGASCSCQRCRGTWTRSASTWSSDARWSRTSRVGYFSFPTDDSRQILWVKFDVKLG